MLDRPQTPGYAEDGALTPHSIPAEQALLGACLMETTALDRIVGLIDEDDFFEDVHRRIFAAMRKRRDAGGLVDHRLVAMSMADVADTDLGGFTVREYVAHLAAEAISVLMAPDYARSIRRLADQRRIISTALTALEEAKLGKEDPGVIGETAIAELDAIAVARQPESVRQVSIEEAANIAYDDMIATRDGMEKPGITTGLRDLDDALAGGLRTGEFWILGGRPGMGKTTVALSILLAAARRGTACYFVSKEMNDTQLGGRALSSLAFRRGHHIPYNLLRSGKATNAEIEAIAAARDAFRDLPIRIEQKGGLTIHQIAARARQVANRYASQGKKLKLLVIDHLGLVKPSSRYSGDRYSEMTELTGTLLTLCKELDVAILALAQLNRQLEQRSDKRPQLSDLRDSGSLEQDADGVIFAFREAYYLERDKPFGDDDGKWVERMEQVQNQIELIVAKQRMGPTKAIRAFCSVACNAIADLEQRSML